MDEVVPRIPIRQRLPLPWRGYRIVARAAAADLIPDRLPRRGVVVVGPEGREAWMALDCPCPDRHRLLVNLDRTRRPAWTFATEPGLSLRPSIDDAVGDRRCHFILREGKIHWAKDTRRPT